MSRNTTRKMKGGVKRRVRTRTATLAPPAKKRKTQTARNSASPSIEIRSDADVKKAVGMMNKHPISLVLVYAVWCPHCHTFMEQWNKYKKLPNRNSPMIAVEQTFMNKLLPHIQTKEGGPMSVEGFPTVIMNMNKSAVGAAESRGQRSESGQNVGEIIEDPRNESAMSELLSNSGSRMVNANSSMSMPTIGTTAVNASVFENSIQGSQDRKGSSENMNENTVEINASMSSTPVSAKRAALTKKVAAAIKNASNEAESLRSAGNDELDMSNIAASSKGTFVSRPKREAMSGGGKTAPSGLCQLGGGSGRADSLLAQLGAYAKSN